ncbi:uncharacterized protein B0T15DRAFT_526234 [Chaetomium strumarium]|uniref:Uncharacterized protein n=1 Tax=Chaetomium strumarium TaxID=1170767 RepID=A0AAJ0H081_9PEZI|nr:hypothetical protein B0T15DRAFT_526234 [Chaetomium strumarium]
MSTYTRRSLLFSFVCAAREVASNVPIIEKTVRDPIVRYPCQNRKRSQHLVGALHPKRGLNWFAMPTTGCQSQCIVYDCLSMNLMTAGRNGCY